MLTSNTVLYHQAVASSRDQALISFHSCHLQTEHRYSSYFKYGCHKGTLRVLHYPEWFVLTKTLQSKANCCYCNTTYFLLFPMLLLLLKCSLQINFDNPNVIILSSFKHYLFNVDVVKNHNSAGFSLPSLAALHMDMYQRNIHLPGRLGMIQTPYTYSAQNR